MTIENPKLKIPCWYSQFVTQSFLVYAKYHESVRQIIYTKPQESVWYIYQLLVLPYNGSQLAFEQIHRAIRGDMSRLHRNYSKTPQKEQRSEGMPIPSWLEFL